MKVGFIGTGNIASAVIEGLCKAACSPSQIFVSPRNAEKAANLAKLFKQVSVAKNNQEVINNSDYIFIALRPNAVESALKELTFLSNQTIISLIPTFPMNKISGLVHPASLIIRAVPLPPVANHIGPVIFYPKDKIAYTIFKKISIPIAVKNEKQLHVLWAMTALISPYFALLEETSKWAIDAGVDQKTAKKYTASMFHALSSVALQAENASFSEMAKEAATPGGLNEQAVKIIKEEGGFKTFIHALNQVIVRFGEKPIRKE